MMQVLSGEQMLAQERANFKDDLRIAALVMCRVATHSGSTFKIQLSKNFQGAV